MGNAPQIRTTATATATGPAWPAALGAVLAALSIGLSAYAAHGLEEGPARANVQTACVYAFGHGVALAALWPHAGTRLARAALYVLLLGTVLFCGSVAGGALAGWPTRLAPSGGMLMMGAWLAWAVSVLRRG